MVNAFILVHFHSITADFSTPRVKCSFSNAVHPVYTKFTSSLVQCKWRLASNVLSIWIRLHCNTAFFHRFFSDIIIIQPRATYLVTIVNLRTLGISVLAVQFFAISFSLFWFGKRKERDSLFFTLSSSLAIVYHSIQCPISRISSKKPSCLIWFSPF